MTIECAVDGSFFIFPEGWRVEKPDEWSEQKKLTRSPFFSKGCDLVALNSRDLWLVEAKDYTYPGALIPDDLADEVGRKVFHTLAVLHAVALWGEGAHREFSRQVMMAREARICLAVELPDGGRRLMGVATPLANLQTGLKKVTQPLNVPHPVVSNSHLKGGVPWIVRRDPGTRNQHADR